MKKSAGMHTKFNFNNFYVQSFSLDALLPVLASVWSVSKITYFSACVLIYLEIRQPSTEVAVFP
jgi:hypothetical protein